MIYDGYFENIIALIRWDADHYLPDGETERVIFMKVHSMILGLQRKEERESEKRPYKKASNCGKTRKKDENNND